MPQLATNKQALANYHLLEKIEAGIVLSRPAGKYVQKSNLNLKGSYVTIDSASEAWLTNAHISAYRPAAAHQIGYQPNQKRKLLLKQKEIDYLRGKEKERGLTILAISVYTKGSLIKLELAVARGKKQFDKRASIKKRELDRQIRRTLKNSRS